MQEDGSAKIWSSTVVATPDQLPWVGNCLPLAVGSRLWFAVDAHPQHHMDLLMNFVSVLTSMMSINLKPCFSSAPVQVQRLACVCKSWKVYTTSVHSLAGAGGGLCCGSSSSSASCGSSACKSVINSVGAGAASELLTKGSSICWTRWWVFAASSCTLSEA